MGVTGPDQNVKVATTLHSHLLERAQRVRITMAVMCYHRFYIGFMARYQLILYQILIEAGLK